MSTHPNDPLSPEERELAQLMGRLGPTGEPSPTLDAKILAAAHAAATGKPAPVGKPRWPVAIGLAASVVFAVGIAWQLRPLQQVASVQEAPAADDRATAVVAPKVIAEPMAQDAAAAADSIPALAPPSPPEAPAPVAQSIREQAPRVMPRPLPARKAVPSVERTEPRRSAAYAPPPPPAPPAPPTPVAPAPAQASTPQAFAAEAGAMADAAVAKQAPTPGNARALDARQSATRNEAKAANAAAAREEESTTLDRVEVTGSRLRTDLQVPVSDDARLAVDDWLERVRTRYGLGDADAARQSLLLFVKDHPSETVPEDLEPLLDE